MFPFDMFIPLYHTYYVYIICLLVLSSCSLRSAMTGRIGYGITLPALSVASAKQVAQRPMCSLAPKTWSDRNGLVQSISLLVFSHDAAARDALVHRLLKSALPTSVVDIFMRFGSLFLGSGFAILALVATSFVFSGGIAKRVARGMGGDLRHRPPSTKRRGGDPNPSQEAAGKPKCYLVGGFRDGGQGKENVAHGINLNESISKIKKKLPQLKLAQLRVLSADEARGKNRKGLQSVIKKAMHAA